MEDTSGYGRPRLISKKHGRFKEKLFIHPPNSTWTLEMMVSNTISPFPRVHYFQVPCLFLGGCKLKNQSWVFGKRTPLKLNPGRVSSASSASCWFQGGYISHNHHAWSSCFDNRWAWNTPRKTTEWPWKKTTKHEWSCIPYEKWWFFQPGKCWFSGGQLISQAPWFSQRRSFLAAFASVKWWFLPW